MALQAPSSPRPPKEEDVEAGVIEDARARQRRFRVIGAALIAAAVVAGGLIVGFTGGSRWFGCRAWWWP